VILIADRGFYGGFGYSGDSDMRSWPRRPAPRHRSGNKQDKLKDAFNQIQNELRSQYNIGYTRATTAHGSYRKIQIKAKGGEYKVQARRAITRSRKTEVLVLGSSIRWRNSPSPDGTCYVRLGFALGQLLG